ncbi:Toll-like receptor 4 [Anabarilius grahami]|uniref:Toll-like receptor 4 n=1 Tax=Anabarilius grahami TaxID=495550 RepID=A0A3N0XX17_ANAGA|nr:Toll-like receptor 4 [Anabarilius grahami]
MLNWRRSSSVRRAIGPSDHSDWLFSSYCHLLERKGISSYAGAERTCHLAVGCQASVCYDEAWVMNELMENLENGVPPIHLCLHMRDFQAGKSIASNIIDEGIMGSRKVIVVVSQHFIDSAWCRFEFELAQSRFMMERNANIIIIILEDVEERKTKKVFGLHKHLKKNTYLKWSRDPLSNMRFWIRLRRAIIKQ